MWYPTEDEEGYSAAYQNIFRDDLSFDQAVPAAPIHQGGYPVLVHSHGFRGFGGNSAAIMRHFASHGWVAIAPDHTGNTIFEDDPLPTAHYYHRPMDIARALDELDTVDLPGTPRTERVLMSGHSFGIYTTWAMSGASYDEAEIRRRCDAGEMPSGTCTEAEITTLAAGFRDPRVVAAIPMAGGYNWFFGDSGYDDAVTPMFLMTGTDDDVGADALFDEVTGVDLRWIDVDGGCHQLFGLGGCDLIPDEEGFPIVNTYALAFARMTVLGDEQAAVTGILDGSTQVSTRVSFHRK
jgi:predicted dienelactone hydrolase